MSSVQNVVTLRKAAGIAKQIYPFGSHCVEETDFLPPFLAIFILLILLFFSLSLFHYFLFYFFEALLPFVRHYAECY